MSNQYWISNVGGDCVVGGTSQVYDGQEYINSSDDDMSDSAYSTLCGALWSEESRLEGFDELGATIREKRDRLKKKKAKQGFLSPEDEKELARLRAKIDKDKGPLSFVSDAVKSVGKIGGDMVYNLNQVVRLPGKAVKATLGQIPVIGKPIQAVVNLTPDQALGGLTAKVLSGERLDKAFLATGREQIKAVRDVAPYVQTVMTFVPGVGTGVAAAIAAGTALAEGRTITDAVISSVKGAVPGGPLGKAAFDGVLAVAKGQRLDKAAIAVGIKQLPAEAQTAVKAALAVAKGKDAKAVVLQALRSHLPKDAQKAADIALAIAAGRNIQSTIISKVVEKKSIEKLAKDGANLVKKVPILKSATKGMSPQKAAGFTAAMGAITKGGANAHALAAMRAKLGKPQREGFDHAVKTLVNKANPGWVTLVKGGMVLRGPFKQVAKGHPDAISGRVIKNGKVQSGLFAR
jgi:hypothetical protein